MRRRTSSSASRCRAAAEVRWLLPVLALAALAGCGGGESPSRSDPTSPVPATTTATTMPGDSSSTSAPRTITPADDGRTYTMVVGQTTTLALTDSNAPQPVLDGTSVLLIEIVNITAGTGRQWEVRAVKNGTSSIRDGGSADWVIQLEVT